MIRLPSKNDNSLLCYDVIITHQILIDLFCDFSSDTDHNIKTDVLSYLSYQYEAHPEDTKCPPAAQHNKRIALVKF